MTDPGRIADFLELRLKRHPKMIGEILKADGLNPKPSRAELEAYAGKLAMVIIRPQAGRLADGQFNRLAHRLRAASSR